MWCIFTENMINLILNELMEWWITILLKKTLDNYHTGLVW